MRLYQRAAASSLQSVCPHPSSLRTVGGDRSVQHFPILLCNEIETITNLIREYLEACSTGVEIPFIRRSDKGGSILRNDGCAWFVCSSNFGNIDRE